MPSSDSHDLIDPVGLALENFDAVGRWRELEAGVPVEPSESAKSGMLGAQGARLGMDMSLDLMNGVRRLGRIDIFRKIRHQIFIFIWSKPRDVIATSMGIPHRSRESTRTTSPRST